MNQRDVDMIVTAYEAGVVPLAAVAVVLGIYKAQIGHRLTSKDLIELTGATRSRGFAATKKAREHLRETVPENGTHSPGKRDSTVPENGTQQSRKTGLHLLQKVEEKTPPYIPPHGGGAEGFAPQGSPKPEPNPRPARRPSKRRDPEGYRRQLEADLADLED